MKDFRRCLFFSDGNRIISDVRRFNFMADKHLLRKRKDEDDFGLRRDIDSDDDEWSKVTKGVGEKIEAADIMEVADRTITFNKNEAARTKEEDYMERSEDFKDGFGTTAQYLKFVNAHLAEKKFKLDKIKTQIERFDKEMASLKPSNERSLNDLNHFRYNELKPDDVKQVLSILEKEKEAVRAKIEHFNSQISLANEELGLKESQIKEIETELTAIKNQEPANGQAAINPSENPEESIKKLQNELNSIGKNSENEKIFGAINSLVVILNSKNQETVNELNSMKAEFNKMRQDYEQALEKLKEKKS